MIFAVTCPQCSARCKLPADVAGKKLQCPKCQETFVVSANDIEEIPDMTKSAPPATQPPMNSPRVEEDRPRRRPIDEDDDYEAPRPRHTKVAKMNPTVLYGAIGGGILGVGLLVFSIIYFTRDKKKESAGTNPPQEVAANNANPDSSRPLVNKQVEIGKGRDIPNVVPRPPMGPAEEPKGPPNNVPTVGPGPITMVGMQEGPPTAPAKEPNSVTPNPSNEPPKGIGPQGSIGEEPPPKKEAPGGAKEGPFGPPKGGFPGGGQQFLPKNGPVAKDVGSVPIAEMVKDLLYPTYITVAVDLEQIRKNQIAKLIADDMMRDGGVKTLLMLQRAGFKDADFSKIVYQVNGVSSSDVPMMAAVRFTDSIDKEKMVMGLQASEKKSANSVYYVAVDGSAFFFPSDDTVVIAPRTSPILSVLRGKKPKNLDGEAMFEFASAATMARIHGRAALYDGRLTGINGALGMAMIANMAGEKLVIETRVKMSDARSAEQAGKMLSTNQVRRRALQTNNTGGFVLDAVTTALTKEAIENTTFDIEGDEIRSIVSHSTATLIRGIGRYGSGGPFAGVRLVVGSGFQPLN